MNLKDQIKYEYVIIKHAIERGCPEDKLEDCMIKHPELERKLMEEGEYHSVEDEDYKPKDLNSV